MSNDLDQISNPDDMADEKEEDKDVGETMEREESVNANANPPRTIQQLERDILCKEYEPDSAKRSSMKDSDNRQRNLRPARRCKFGSECKFRMNCSYIHATFDEIERRKLAVQFCYCTDSLCCRPHPDRVPPPRKRMRDFDSNDMHFRRDPILILCTNCKKPGHKVMYCPHLRCDYCKRYGHIASVCEERRAEFMDSRNNMRRF